MYLEKDKIMNKKNTTKKSTKPAYIVDITWCETEDDVKTAFIFAKAENKIPVTVDDIIYLIVKTMIGDLYAFATVQNAASTVDDTLSKLCKLLENPGKKKPWYKRLWDRLTGRK